MTDLKIKTVTMIVGVITVIAGIVQYGMTKRSEFRKRFWEEQLAIYRTVCAAAASLATAASIEEVEKERLEFWRLYWGEMSILENKQVKRAMEMFGQSLRIVEAKQAPIDSLKQPSYSLARACRESLEKTWDPAGIDDLSDDD